MEALCMPLVRGQSEKKFTGTTLWCAIDTPPPASPSIGRVLRWLRCKIETKVDRKSARTMRGSSSPSSAGDVAKKLLDWYFVGLSLAKDQIFYVPNVGKTTGRVSLDVERVGFHYRPRGLRTTRMMLMSLLFFHLYEKNLFFRLPLCHLHL